MNFDELNDIISRETGINICPICGVPFEKYHSRQKTCGTDECKRLWRNRYFNERRRRMLAEHPEEFRAYRREAEKKTRRKKGKKEMMRRNYKKMQTYWERQQEIKLRETDGGLEYGKKQVEKTLTQVPKIDTSGFEKREK